MIKEDKQIRMLRPFSLHFASQNCSRIENIEFQEKYNKRRSTTRHIKIGYSLVKTCSAFLTNDDADARRQ